MTITLQHHRGDPVPWALFALALAVGVFLGSALTATTAWLTGRIDLGSISPAALERDLTLPSPEPARAQRGVLERELEAARFSEAQHLRSLMDLRDDPRWAEEGQRQALAGAMQQNAALFRERRAAATELQARLDRLP